MTIEWRDRTSYAQGERGTVEPSAWHLDVPDLGQVVVHRWLNDTSVWYGSCRALAVDRVLLNAADAQLARAEFLRYLTDHAARLHAAIVKVTA